MILSLSINLFDGEELLEPMLRALRAEVDHVSIVYQTKSYSGNPCSPILLSVLDSLIKQGLVDQLLEYKCQPTEDFNPQVYEAEKRTLGLKLAKEFGATHFISLDADEFLHQQSIAYAKQQVITHDYDATACKLIDYWVSPRFQLPGMAQAWGDYLYIPLIYKIRPGLAFTSENGKEKFFCVADTTRKLPNEHPCRLDDSVIMHHMTTVRAQRFGMISKYENRSSHIPPVLPSEHMADLLRAWLPRPHWGPKVIEVPDTFGIEESFIRQKLIEDQNNTAVVIKEWDESGTLTLRGNYADDSFVHELDAAIEVFKAFLKELESETPEDAMRFLDPAYKNCVEVLNWIQVYKHMLAIVRGNLNLCVLRHENDRYTAAAAVSWIGEGAHVHGKVRTDTSTPTYLNESGLAATKDVGGVWTLTGFQNLW